MRDFGLLVKHQPVFHPEPLRAPPFAALSLPKLSPYFAGVALALLCSALSFLVELRLPLSIASAGRYSYA